MYNFTFENFIKYREIEITERIISSSWTGFKDADIVLISFEYRELIYNLKREYNKNNIIYNNNEFGELLKFKENNIDFKSIIFVRSAYSNIVSIFNFYINNGNQIKKAIETTINHIRLWEMYANYFCNNEIDSIKIYYDKFVESVGYQNKNFNILDLVSINNSKSKYTYKSKHTKSSYISKNNSRKLNQNINEIIIENIDKKIFLDLFDKNIIQKLNNLINEIKNNSEKI